MNDTQDDLRSVIHRWIMFYASGNWTIAGRDWPDFVRRLDPWGHVGGDDDAVKWLTDQVCSIPEALEEVQR